MWRQTPLMYFQSLQRFSISKMVLLRTEQWLKQLKETSFNWKNVKWIQLHWRLCCINSFQENQTEDAIVCVLFTDGFKRVFISRSCGNTPARFHRILGVSTSYLSLYCTDVLFTRLHYFKVWRKNAIISRYKVPIPYLGFCQTFSCSVDLDWWPREPDSSPLKIDNVKTDRVSEQNSKTGFPFNALPSWIEQC